MSTLSTLDLSFFPLVLVVIPNKVDQSYADLLEADHRVLFAKYTRYVSLSDASLVSGVPDAVTRRRLGEWAKSHEADLRQWQVANAIIVPSRVTRAGLSAIHWLAPPPVPTTVEIELAQGLAFLKRAARAEKMSTAGIDAFAAARRLDLTGT